MFLVCFFFKQNANSNEVHTNWHNHAYTQNCILLHLPASYVIQFSFVVIFIMIFFSNSRICLKIFLPHYESDDLNRFELNFVNAKPVCGKRIRHIDVLFIYIEQCVIQIQPIWNALNKRSFRFVHCFLLFPLLSTHYTQINPFLMYFSFSKHTNSIVFRSITPPSCHTFDRSTTVDGPPSPSPSLFCMLNANANASSSSRLKHHFIDCPVLIRFNVETK